MVGVKRKIKGQKKDVTDTKFKRERDKETATDGVRNEEERRKKHSECE